MPLKSELEENPFAFNIEEDEIKSARQYRENFDSEEEFQEALAIWPRCPKCGRRRITRCPVCKTSADLFPLGDDEFFNPDVDPNANDDQPRRPACTKCHAARQLFDESERAPIFNGEIIPGAPDPRRKIELELSDALIDTPEHRERRREWNATNEERQRQEPPTLVCYVCSEAFRPTFPRRCEWCDYDFGEGENYPEPSEIDNPEIDAFIKRKELQEQEAFEPDSKRITWVCVAIAIATLAFLAYWASIF